MENKYTFKLTIEDMKMIRFALETMSENGWQTAEKTEKCDLLASLFDRRISDAIHK